MNSLATKIFVARRTDNLRTMGTTKRVACPLVAGWPGEPSTRDAPYDRVLGLDEGAADTRRVPRLSAAQDSLQIILWVLFVGWIILCSGCAAKRANVEKHLMESRTPRPHVVPCEAYRFGCQDVLNIQLAHHPQWNTQVTVGVDGRVTLPSGHRPRIEYATPREAAEVIAASLKCPAENVHIRVAEYKSQHVYLFGQVEGAQRSVAYRGPETVLELLQRAGGITPGAEPNDVYVVRSHLAAGKRPEVFHVKLRAIVLDNDHRTNIRVQPFDQIHVGETRQARIERSIPPWVRPMYRVFWDTRPKENPFRRPIGKRLHQARRRMADRRFPFDAGQGEWPAETRTSRGP